MRKTIICSNTNCGFRGAPEKKARGSRIVLLFLLLLGVLPGLLYLLFFSGYTYSCPQCGVRINADT